MENLYQFNLDFNLRYIRGQKVSEDENFITIKYESSNIPNLNIKSTDGLICLSKNAIAYYYKIN